MNWKLEQTENLRTNSGAMVPSGTVWQIDADARHSGIMLLKCQTIDELLNLSTCQYLQLFGQDDHVWKVIQKSQPTQPHDTLDTEIGAEWTIVEFGDKVIGNCLIDGTLMVAAKNIKSHSIVSYTFSYPEYIDYFGEDKHVNKQKITEKRFDL